MDTKRKRFIRLPEVMSRTGQSRSQIYRLIQLGKFPAQIKLSTRSSAWVEGAVDAWIEAKVDGGDHAE